MAKLTCTVVTPEKSIFDGEADSITIPAHDGEVGILPGHARFLARLGVGELKIASGGESTSMFVDGGFVQVAEDKVTVLTDSACGVDEIDMREAENQLDRLRDEPGKGEEFANANNRLMAMKRVKDRFQRA